MKLHTSLMAFIRGLAIILAGFPCLALGEGNPRPLIESINVPAGDLKRTDEILLPIITWGGDIATILANGDSELTIKDSFFGQKGLKFKLLRIDDFTKQLQMFIGGETPYLRGTMGMINQAAELLSRDPRTKPVVIYQLTWSAGGDCLVVKETIKTARDLKGKIIALQQYGPHVDYLATLLRGAGLSLKDVTLRWTQDLTGTDNTPVQAFYGKDVDAAFVIIPDGMMLTSNGTVGTGAEGSVKGARILLSTKTANRVIADIYAVRSDYLAKNREKVQAFVHGLLLGEQELRKLFKEKEQRTAAFKKTLTAAAKLLLDSPQATGDVEGLYRDCEFVGFPGNVQFFGDPNWSRNFEKLTEEIQSFFVSIGLLSKKTRIEHAQWEYDKLRTGLVGIEAVQTPRFREQEVAKVVEQKRAKGTLEEGEIFSFEIRFQPNQDDFSPDMYEDDFKKVVELASTYGGAVIVVEGHSDPMNYLSKKKQGADELMLKRITQAARNLSLARSHRVRDSVVAYAKSKGMTLDPSQFTVIGHGISRPKTGICGGEPCVPKTKDEWLSNMRVVFRVIQVEAEQSVFTPLQ